MGQNNSMYTCCTHCQTWFALRASQLRIGRGEVRCGHCFQIFNALEHLREVAPPEEMTHLPAPPAASHVEAESAEPNERVNEPQMGDITLLGDGRNDTADVLGPSWSDADDESWSGEPVDTPGDAFSTNLLPEIQPTQTAVDAEPALPEPPTWEDYVPAGITTDLTSTAAASPNGMTSAQGFGATADVTQELIVARDETAHEAAHESTQVLPTAAPVPEATEQGDWRADAPAHLSTDGDDATRALSAHRSELSDDEVMAELMDRNAQAVQDSSEIPSVLRADIDLPTPSEGLTRSQWPWLAGVALLMAGLFFQYMWFLPDDMVSRYPLTASMVDSFCERAHCRRHAKVDRAKIELLSRDVRIHPGYEGALQVTLSMVNHARYMQTYPHIQFTLFNVNGRTIVSRVFAPSDYINHKGLLEAGLAPSTPVQVVLDLLAPEEAAVSFEFRFI
ncbi:MAG: DUF3426 domain-containing protein [Gammaproteobacteria bacterium]|nr:DUF3426 domain-containing protein [Gammaproteobacteria bacterium]